MLHHVTDSKYDTQLYGAHSEHAVSVLILHLDDDHDPVQDAIQETLTKLHRLDSKRLKNHASKQKDKHSNPARINYILNLTWFCKKNYSTYEPDENTPHF